MPKRKDLHIILVIGSGPIQIGQGCEFDYAGTQACKVLKDEGYKVVLINSNPATIMTDPEIADVTYIEDINVANIEKIIKKEKPDALLPTMGGQVALNITLELYKKNIIQENNIEILGAPIDSIVKAENREQFKHAMRSINVDVPNSAFAHSMLEATKHLTQFNFPLVIRSSFTLGGEFGGIAYNKHEFDEICQNILTKSPEKVILMEEYLHHWKEIELEVIRDTSNNCIVICGIENIDPMGVHTGDSIIVAPIQTLTDKEYQKIRNIAFAVLREIGVTTGGANVQFAINPQNGRIVVIEMNPRVSRSSALASKATGFPIAKVAAKLAIGYKLDELRNEITANKTPIAFEPTIDYVVVKFPKFTFDKFPEIKPRLTTYMQSVGEVMAIGSNFTESLLKAITSLEQDDVDLTNFEKLLAKPHPNRIFFILEAIRKNINLDEINALTGIDKWFLYQLAHLIKLEKEISKELNINTLFAGKKYGMSDKYIADLTNKASQDIKNLRNKFNISPVYKAVDSCAAEFRSITSFYYSTYEKYCELPNNAAKKVVIIGSGPNRIGQGIEFDYCCVHAVNALKKLGFETIMINSNPETVSTDFSVTDKLFFEPLTAEYVLAVLAAEQPYGVIVQLGGQTSINLAGDIEAAGFKLLGTDLDSINMAEDRSKAECIAKSIGLQYPDNYTAKNRQEIITFASKISYPIILRSSFIIGGKAIMIAKSSAEFEEHLANIVYPVHIDKFIDNAKEVDVDLISDGEQIFVVAILEHLEPTGVHSGDSHCVIPPISISAELQEIISTNAIKIASSLKIIGLCNIQFALKNNDIYLIEVNPRASRTVPFVAKAINNPIVDIAVKCIMGNTLKQQGVTSNSFKFNNGYAIKKPIFPHHRLPGAIKSLGPEMKSIGEVMCRVTNKSYVMELIK